MVYSSVGYCSCGQEIWIEYLHGLQGWRCRFFGADNQQILACPACGRELKEDDLESR